MRGGAKKTCLGELLGFPVNWDALLLYPALHPSVKLSRCGSGLNPMCLVHLIVILTLYQPLWRNNSFMTYCIYLINYFQWKVIKQQCHKNTGYIYIMFLLSCWVFCQGNQLTWPHCPCLHPSGWGCLSIFSTLISQSRFSQSSLWDLASPVSFLRNQG